MIWCLREGRVPVAVFGRTHGDVRMMGPGRMEREEPWMDPVSATEALWYRGFVYRAFDETAEGVMEFYFLPQDFMDSFPQPEIQESRKMLLYGRWQHRRNYGRKLTLMLWMISQHLLAVALKLTQ